MTPTSRLRLSRILVCWLLLGTALLPLALLRPLLEPVGGDLFWCLAMPLLCLGWLHLPRGIRAMLARPRRTVARRPIQARWCHH